MQVLDILSDLPYRQVEAVFKTVALAVIEHDAEQGAIEVPDKEIIITGE